MVNGYATHSPKNYQNLCIEIEPSTIEENSTCFWIAEYKSRCISAPVLTGSVFTQKNRLFLAQCTLYIIEETWLWFRFVCRHTSEHKPAGTDGHPAEGPVRIKPVEDQE